MKKEKKKKKKKRKNFDPVFINCFIEVPRFVTEAFPPKHTVIAVRTALFPPKKKLMFKIFNQFLRND